MNKKFSSYKRWCCDFFLVLAFLNFKIFVWSQNFHTNIYFSLLKHQISHFLVFLLHLANILLLLCCYSISLLLLSASGAAVLTNIKWLLAVRSFNLDFLHLWWPSSCRSLHSSLFKPLLIKIYKQQLNFLLQDHFYSSCRGSDSLARAHTLTRPHAHLAARSSDGPERSPARSK